MACLNLEIIVQKHSAFIARLLPPAALTLGICGIAAAAGTARVDTLQVPGEPLASFDIGIVEGHGTACIQYAGASQQ